MEIFKLIGKLSIVGLPQAENAMSKIGGAATKMGKVVAAGVAAGAAAITKMAKDAVDSYAEYEQLVGGVETLFKDSGDKVLQYAQDAYKTAGLSANEYMSTVTSFSAALLQSLNGDTAKAATAADLAITDMSDNANKMGSSMESIQNAYQGFAKQNYTMLDNLKLGYGGTKTEMERLLADAEKLSGQKFDLSSYADIVEAIHVVQTEMGITGTTAKEASTTIQGSAASMKAAWQNLLTGMADENQNLDLLLAQFLDSVEAFGNNLIPRIEKLLPRLVSAAAKLVNNLAGRLPTIIETLLPVVIEGAVNLVASLIKNLPRLTKSIITAAVNGLKAGFPAVKEAGTQLVQGLWNGINNAKDWVIEKIKGFGDAILSGIKEFFGIHSPSKVMEEEVGVQLAHGVAEGIDKGKGKAKKSAEEMGQEILGKAEQTLKEYKRLHDMSTVQEAAYWQAIVRQTKKGTDARLAAEDRYYSALESYKQQYNDYVNNIMNQTSLFEAFALGEEEVTGDQLISNLESQIGGLETYYDTMESLQARIGGTALMEKLQELGTDSLAELTAINNMTDEQLQEYVLLYDEKYQLAKEKAVAALGEMDGAVKTYTTKMATTTADKFKEIQAAISTRMQAAVTAVKTAVAEMNAALATAPIGDTVGVAAANVEAHAAGGILTKPTIFGYTPATNTYHLGGEAGAEAIAPIDVLQGYVRQAVAEGMSNGNSTNLLAQIAELLQMILHASENAKIEIDGREFGRMVKSYA